ncbi:hypothetical protein ACWERI_26170 [Streptomyces collinus]
MQPGQTLLVHGAGGNVGTVAVQLAGAYADLEAHRNNGKAVLLP